MNTRLVNELVADWDEVYKKGQLSLWVLLAIYDGKKYAAQITDFMNEASGGAFEVKEQSLYRALRRFGTMGLVTTSSEQSPTSGPKRKYYTLTAEGAAVLSQFVSLHIQPLMKPSTAQLLQEIQSQGEQQ